jgi:hypothetical protein
MFPLPEGGKAFTDDGKLVDPQRQQRLEKLLAAYLATASKLTR